MAQGNVLGQSIGQKINGIIEEYKISGRPNPSGSSNDIKAGDFVRFVNEYNSDINTTAGEINDLETTFSWSSMQCFKLSETSIIIVYQLGDNIYGVIGTITNEDITLGTTNLLISDSTMFQGINILTSNKISLAYKLNTNFFKIVYCSITNNSINVVNSKQYVYPFNLDTTTLKYTLGDIMIQKLDENRIFITYTIYQPSGYYDNENKHNLYGLICTITNENITFGDTLILDFTNFGKTKPINSILTLSENKVLIIYRYMLNRAQIGITSDSNLPVHQKGILCNIDETNNILVEQNTLLYEADITSTINHTFILVNPTTILYLYKIDSNLYGIVFKLDNDNFEQSKKILLSNNLLDTTQFKAIMNLSNDTIYYTYNIETPATDETPKKSKLIGKILKIDDLDIKVIKTETVKEITNDINSSFHSTKFEYITPIALVNNKFNLIVETYNQTLQRNVLKYFSLDITINYINQLIKKVNNKDNKILGIAKTAGTAGQTIKVYVPKIEEVN